MSTPPVVLPAAVLWDLDGTLIDSEPAWGMAVLGIAAAHGVAWTVEDLRASVGQHLPVVGAWLHERGVPLPPDDIVEAMVAAVAAGMERDGVPWRPGARELLAALAEAGIPGALVTMSYRRLADLVVADAPPGALVVVVAGDEVVEGKPHPEAYLRAAARLGVDVRACVAVEDSPNGVASAEASGARVVAIPHLVDVPAAPGRSRLGSLVDLDLAVLSRVTAGEVVDEVVTLG